VEAKTVPPADAFSLQQLYSPVQVVSGWEATLGVSAPVVSFTAPPALPKAAPQVKPAAPPAPVAKSVEMSAPSAVEPPKRETQPAKTETIQEKPAAKSVAPVAQMRLDAALNSPIPKPHATVAPLAVAKTPEIKPEPQSEVPPQAKPSGALQPAWEVDRFQWPEHCKQLLSGESQFLADVGKRLASAAKDGLNILAITSTRRGEGRTTLALCLAKAAAEAGVKVALVDADGENPQLVNELGVEAACGWHDVVLGKQPMSESAIVSLEDKLTFFPWTTPGAIKSLNDPQVTRVLKAMASVHELVILDLGPTPGRETRLFEDGESCPVDAAILVRDVRWTSALESQRVAAHLVSAGVESVGIAENFGPRTPSGT
jgi:Mrp family chromosome partitioning ATPase